MARTRLTPEEAAELRTLFTQEFDWEQLADLAAWQGVIPLVTGALARVEPKLAPAAFLDRFRSRVRFIAGTNLHLSRELIRLVELLESHGIRVLPLKGPVVAQLLYGNVAMRQFSDLDILIRPADVSRTMELLAATGFDLEMNLSGLRELSFRYAEHHYGAERRDLGLRVEVHWAVSPMHVFYPVDLEGLLRGAGEVRLLGRRVPCPAPGELLILLCVHGSKHFWASLRWVCDIAELLRSQELDWRRVFERADALGCRRMLHLGLRLACELLGAPLPDAVRTRVLADTGAQRLAEDVRVRLFDRRRMREGRLPDWLFHVRMRERWSDRLRCVLGTVYLSLFGATTISQRDREFMALPDFLDPLYLLVRPLRVGMDLFRARGTQGERKPDAG